MIGGGVCGKIGEAEEIKRSPVNEGLCGIEVVRGFGEEEKQAAVVRDGLRTHGDCQSPKMTNPAFDCGVCFGSAKFLRG
jgi:hypothetical protein